jgi:perosamine synthetase
MKTIPVAGPWITEKEIAYVSQATQDGWYDRSEHYQKRFEALFATHTGRLHAITLPSCTSALHLALLALGIGPGDEVIVPEITWIATAAPISYVGATPVFADIEPDSWCLSHQSVEQRISPKTRAIIAVDLYGNMPDLDALQTLAAKHQIALIEDAAQAIGSRYKNKPAGSFGTFSTFSFHGSKTLTTGEGGMLLTDNSQLYERCLFLHDHGRDPNASTLFWNTEVAYKYKMSAMQAALGIAQMERLTALTDKKKTLFQQYQAGLASCSGIRLNTTRPDVENTYWMATILLDESLGWKKDPLRLALQEKDIQTRPFFHPLSQLPAYSNLADRSKYPQANPVAYTLSPYGLNLPSALILEKDDIQRVCSEIIRLLGGEANGQ